MKTITRYLLATFGLLLLGCEAKEVVKDAVTQFERFNDEFSEANSTLAQFEASFLGDASVHLERLSQTATRSINKEIRCDHEIVDQWIVGRLTNLKNTLSLGKDVVYDAPTVVCTMSPEKVVLDDVYDNKTLELVFTGINLNKQGAYTATLVDAYGGRKSVIAGTPDRFSHLIDLSAYGLKLDKSSRYIEVKTTDDTYEIVIQQPHVNPELLVSFHANGSDGDQCKNQGEHKSPLNKYVDWTIGLSTDDGDGGCSLSFAIRDPQNRLEGLEISVLPQKSSGDNCGPHDGVTFRPTKTGDKPGTVIIDTDSDRGGCLLWVELKGRKDIALVVEHSGDKCGSPDRRTISHGQRGKFWIDTPGGTCTQSYSLVEIEI